ncbi:MAG: flagellar hook assembly protein FlgD [Candidatus Nitrotoga sp.]
MINATPDTGSTASLFASLNAGSDSTAKASAADMQNRFLKLLVTQMKNQDPLNPMDNAQVTSQMAQLSTVTGIDKLNVTLQALSDSMLPNQSLQAAGMIGRGVLVPGNNIEIINGAGFGGVDLSQSVDQVDITIQDSAGVPVRNIRLGAQSAGLVNWQWDGRSDAGVNVVEGSYTFSVNAAQAGAKVAVTALQYGVVNSVMQGKQGVTLSAGQMDGIALSQVRQIF